MDAVARTRAADRLHAVTKRSVAALRAERRRFWLGLTCALVLHAALIFGVSRSSSRIMGDREGQRDGISVELVDAADFLSRSSVPTEPDAPPARPGNMAPPPRPEAKRPTERAPDQPKTTTSSIENETPTASLPTLPGLAGKGGEAPEPKKKAKSAPQPEPPLQLSMPDMQFIPGGRGAAVTRPPGVTRSGENDEFGRGVIRALRQTMPSPTGVLGRVTVRLLLSETGNLVNVQLVRGAEDPLLNQNVVFAAKQASFPIPPVNSTVADRTFLVTYVYR